MFGKLLDTALRAPGEIARGTAEAVTRLPGVPLDVVEKAIDGMERGIEKLADPDQSPKAS